VPSSRSEKENNGWSKETKIAVAVGVAVVVDYIMTGERRSVIAIGGMVSVDFTVGGQDVRISDPRSYQITLPKWWCRKHSFPKHVYVEEMEDGALRVVPE